MESIKKKSRQGLKEKLLWLQAIICMIFCLMPFTLLDPSDNLSKERLLAKGLYIIIIICNFYVNLIWFAPMFIKGRKKEYLIYNCIVVITLSIFLHILMYMNWVMRTPGIHHHLPLLTRVFYILRNIFYLTIAGTTATLLLLMKHWSMMETAQQKAEKERTKAELISLRNQINPHFLLNTMNNIYALTKFNIDRAQKAIIELSELLRHLLYENQNYVCLKDEVVFLENYVSLMSIRLPKEVDIKIDIDIPSHCTLHVAPMMFISLVENAFKHGHYATGNSDQFIHMTIHGTEERILFEIQNTFSPQLYEQPNGLQPTAKKEQDSGIGLQQVEKRLKLAYPNKYEWETEIISDRIYSTKISLYDTKLHYH